MSVPKGFKILKFFSFFRNILADKVTRLTALTVIQSGLLTVAVKALGFTRELLMAFYFGVSETIDNYVLVLLALTFFVVPISGSFSTLITPRYIQFDDKGELHGAASLFQKTCGLGPGKPY